MKCSALLVLAALGFAGCGARPVPVPDPPEVRAQDGVAQMTLTAASDTSGRDVWLFDGRAIPPTIRLSPGVS